MVTFLGLVAVVGLVLANGYFVAAEFSFVAARRGKLEADGPDDRRSARAVEVHRRLSFMLSGAQLGITVTSLVVGFIAEPTLGRALEPVVGAVGVPEGARFGVALTVGFVLATIGQMVLGELAPKNLAIARPEPVARALASSTLVYLKVASLLIRLFDGSANRLLRAVGIEPAEEVHGAVSTAELELIVQESAESGKLTSRQAALLARALEFGELRAADAMVPWNRVDMVGQSATGEDLRAAMGQGHSRFPVVDADGTVAGVVHAKDLLGVAASELAGVPVAELARPVVAVPEAAKVRVVLERLRGQATELAVVVDEYGAPAGIVTLEDLVEELVGDIEDEHDTEPLAVEPQDGGWLVRGSLRADEVERATGVVLPPGDYGTVAGLVMERLHRVAEPGDRVNADGLTIEVVTVHGWSVASVRLCPPDGDAEAGADPAGRKAGGR